MKTRWQDKTDGKWYGRIKINLPNGRHRYVSQVALNKTHARQVADELEAIFLVGGEQAIDATSMTVAELIEKFRAAEVKPAVYLGERKVSGYKHPGKVEVFLREILEYWSAKRIAEITPQDVREYKSHLVSKPKQRGGGARSPQNVNGILRHFRLLLNYAKRNRWIQSNPCEFVKGLINAADELPRWRPEEPGEIDRLLDQCTGPRAHLRPWIVCAVETALRPGEIDRIARIDINWEAKVIVARATNTKTNKRREVPLTETLEAELRAWLAFVENDEYWSEQIPEKPEALIFGGFKSNKRAFHSACKAAEITNLQRKDLRKWGATRLANALSAAGIPDLHGMAITGHTVVKTYQTYVTTARPAVVAAREALEQARKKDQKN